MGTKTLVFKSPAKTEDEDLHLIVARSDKVGNDPERRITELYNGYIPYVPHGKHDFIVCLLECILNEFSSRRSSTYMLCSWSNAEQRVDLTNQRRCSNSAKSMRVVLERSVFPFPFLDINARMLVEASEFSPRYSSFSLSLRDLEKAMLIGVRMNRHCITSNSNEHRASFLSSYHCFVGQAQRFSLYSGRNKPQIAVGEFRHLFRSFLVLSLFFSFLYFLFLFTSAKKEAVLIFSVRIVTLAVWKEMDRERASTLRSEESMDTGPQLVPLASMNSGRNELQLISQWYNLSFFFHCCWTINGRLIF